jgi:hypothetical protein
MDVEVGRGRFERPYALPSSVRDGELRGIAKGQAESRLFTSRAKVESFSGRF